MALYNRQNYCAVDNLNIITYCLMAKQIETTDNPETIHVHKVLPNELALVVSSNLTGAACTAGTPPPLSLRGDLGDGGAGQQGPPA